MVGAGNEIWNTKIKREGPIFSEKFWTLKGRREKQFNARVGNQVTPQNPDIGYVNNMNTTFSDSPLIHGTKELMKIPWTVLIKVCAHKPG